MEDRRPERELPIAARAETGWQSLVDPTKATRWMGVGASSLDPRPGGLYRVEVLPGRAARGQFVELDPPRRLVWTWAWEAGEGAAPSGSSTLEIELVPTAAGTMLRFMHRGLPNAGEVQRHAHGWDHYLPRLVAAASIDPGPDPWLAGRMP